MSSDRALSNGSTVHRRMTGDAGALRAARTMVAETLKGTAPDVRDAAVLLAGELVTNALVHGGGQFVIDVDVDPERVRVEVADASEAPPQLLRPDSVVEHGRGLAIVDALSDRWGSERRGTDKIVWFVLASCPPA